jgi:hypothetical protein
VVDRCAPAMVANMPVLTQNRMIMTNLCWTVHF